MPAHGVSIDCAQQKTIYQYVVVRFWDAGDEDRYDWKTEVLDESFAYPADNEEQVKMAAARNIDPEIPLEEVTILVRPF